MHIMRLIWASLAGLWVDFFLTIIFVDGLTVLLGIAPDNVELTNPVHVFVRVILPVCMTIVGGGVAGRLALKDAHIAGALVAGWWLIFLSFYGVTEYDTYTLISLIAQCVAVVLAALSAHVVAQRHLKRENLE